MKRAIIIHGYMGRPGTNWKPWLKMMLEAQGFRVDVPEMPNTNHPVLPEWVDAIKLTVGQIGNDDIYLIGHSGGCMAVLRYIETLSTKERIKAAIFIAGFTRIFKGYHGNHDSFFEVERDWAEITKHCDNFIAIHSKDDPLVEFKELDEFKHKLDAQLLAVDGYGHFGSADGVLEVPPVYDAVLSVK